MVLNPPAEQPLAIKHLSHAFKNAPTNINDAVVAQSGRAIFRSCKRKGSQPAELTGRAERRN
jgi:hypothetical protein